MFSYLPRRDDVAGLAAPCVGDEIKNAAGLSQRLNAFLAVSRAVAGSLNPSPPCACGTVMVSSMISLS
jgi:hypothetical protein